MDEATIVRLNRINQRFYSLYSSEFGDTRQSAWAGWRRILDRCERRLAAMPASEQPVTILDAGSGTGRFEGFLARHFRLCYEYLGIDSSPELLRIAGRRSPGAGCRRRELHCVDLLVDWPGWLLDRRRFGLIAVFGLMHHVPGHQRRRRILSQLAACVAPAGWLAVSFWQFGDRERFLRRSIPWAEHNRVTGDAIDPAQLEPGDLLLKWGGGGDEAAGADELGPRRYCHFIDAQESEALVAATGLRAVDRFRADGRSGDLNLYYLLEH